MNSFENTSYSDMVTLFLDGEIDTTSQRVFFEALADNSELQTELQQAVEIKKGFEADRENIVLPAALTSSIFDKAGFSTTNTTTSTSNSGVTAGSTDIITKVAPGFFAKFGSGIISSVAGILLTTGLFQFIILPNIEDRHKEEMTKLLESNNQKIVKIEEPKQNNSIPVVSSTENKPAGGIQNRSKNTLRRLPVKSQNNFVNIKQEDKTEPNTMVDNKPINNPIKKTFSSLDNSIVSAYTNLNTSRSPLTDRIFDRIPQNRSFEPEIERVRDLVLEIKGLTGYYYSYRNFEGPKNNEFLNNLSIGIRKMFDEHHSVSINAGREEFRMYSVDWQNSEPVFKAEENMYWFTAGYRYTSSAIFEQVPFKTFAEGLAGASKFGPIGKLVVGFTYDADKLLTMTFGIEGTGQLFKIREVYQTTTKIGLVYSVGFKF